MNNHLHDDALLWVGGELSAYSLLFGGGDSLRGKRILYDIARLQYGADLGAANGPAKRRERTIACERRIHLNALTAIQTRITRAFAHTTHRNAVHLKSGKRDQVNNLAIYLETAQTAHKTVSIIHWRAYGQIRREYEGSVGVQVLGIARRYGVDVHAGFFAIALDLYGVPFVVVQVKGRRYGNDLDSGAGRVTECYLTWGQQFYFEEIARQIAHLLFFQYIICLI